MSKLRVLEVSGTPYEMGYQHGKAYVHEIRELTEERIHLSSDPRWTGGKSLSRDEVLVLGEACLAEHRAYAPHLIEEIEGMAAATGLGVNELVIMNGFTDFVDVAANYDQVKLTQPVTPYADNCTAFVVGNQAAADGHGFIGQTWDMHATATPYVILLRGRPKNKPAFLVFTITGCVGMIGMNDAGIAIGINNLSGNDGRPGVTWVFAVRKALEQTTLDAALDCITSARLAGGHNYVLADAAGHGYNVEAMATRCHVTPLDANSLVHTNHCLDAKTVALQRPRLPESQQSSETRLNRAQTLLAPGKITFESLVALTRDRGAANGICVLSQPPLYLETSGAAIMRPATREFWAVWGPPIYGEYERFII